jgi:hypothetical protein
MRDRRSLLFAIVAHLTGSLGAHFCALNVVLLVRIWKGGGRVLFWV